MGRSVVTVSGVISIHVKSDHSGLWAASTMVWDSSTLPGLNNSHVGPCRYGGREIPLLLWSLPVIWRSHCWMVWIAAWYCILRITATPALLDSGIMGNHTSIGSPIHEREATVSSIRLECATEPTAVPAYLICVLQSPEGCAPVCLLGVGRFQACVGGLFPSFNQGCVSRNPIID